MKKIVFLISLLTIFLMTLLIAGCGEKAKETPAPVKQESNTPAKSAEPSVQELLSKGKTVNELSYEYVIQMPGSEKMTMKTWIKGKKIRSEMANPAAGENTITIVDSEKGFAYVYQPEQKTATKMDISMTQQEESVTPVEVLDSYKAENMKFIGRETIDSKNCLIYEFTDGSQSKVWLWEENGLPVITEVFVDGEKVVGFFRNLKTGGISDAMFTLPEDTNMVEFNLPKQ